MISPPSGSGAGSELLSRHLSLRPAESFQRSQNSGALRPSPLDPSGRTGEPGQGSLFKAPMPPQQEVCGGAGGGRREPPRAADLNFAGPSQSHDPAFPSSPLSALGSPHPYGQVPGTPRPDYSQQSSEPFPQQSPPYSTAQTPATPRPHSDPPYMVAAPALRLEQYSPQAPGPGPRPALSHQNPEPYSSSPGTPRPSVVERFPPSPASQRSAEASSSHTPRAEQYSQQPPLGRGQKALADGFPPQHVAPASSALAPESLSSAQQQVRPTAQLPGSSSSLSPLLPSLAAVSRTPAAAGRGLLEWSSEHVASAGRLGGEAQAGEPNLRRVSLMVLASEPALVLQSSGFSLFQRQRLRQLILRQQQQKNESRQEKVLQEGAAGPPHHWLQEEPSSAAPADLFGRPPPPYPGTVRPPEATALRCSGNFTAEVARSSSEAPVPRQTLPREPGVQGQAQR